MLEICICFSSYYPSYYCNNRNSSVYNNKQFISQYRWILRRSISWLSQGSNNCSGLLLVSVEYIPPLSRYKNQSCFTKLQSCDDGSREGFVLQEGFWTSKIDWHEIVTTKEDDVHSVRYVFSLCLLYAQLPPKIYLLFIRL